MYGIAARQRRVKERAQELAHTVRPIVDLARIENRDLNAAEEKRLAEVNTELSRLRDETDRIKAEQATMDQIRELDAGLGLDDDFGYGGDGRGYGASYGAGKHLPPRVKATGGSTWGAQLVGKRQQASPIWPISRARPSCTCART
jgi:hypothetical protein